MLIKTIKHGSPISYRSGIINSTGWEFIMIVWGWNRFDHFLKAFRVVQILGSSREIKKICLFFIRKVKQFLSCLNINLSTSDLVFPALSQARFLLCSTLFKSGVNCGLSLPLTLYFLKGACQPEKKNLQRRISMQSPHHWIIQYIPN